MGTITETTQKVVWYDDLFDQAPHAEACRRWCQRGFKGVPNDWPGGFMEWRFAYVIVDGVSALMKPLPRWWDRALWRLYRWSHPLPSERDAIG